MKTAKDHGARSLAIFAFGALLGLAIAAYGLFTTSGARPNHPPPEAMALVNGRPILTSDFIAQSESEAGGRYADITREQRAKVLDDMIAEELFVQRGQELDLAASDPDVRAALVTAVQRQIAAGATAEIPDDPALRAYYDGHVGKYATEGVMRLRDFTLPAPAADAGAIVAALRAGGDVEATKAKYGLSESPGGDRRAFDFAVKARLGDALFDAAQRLGNGGVSDPVATAEGMHVIVMIERQPPVAMPFEKARDRVIVDYLADKRARLVETELRFLRGKADILLSDEAPK